MVDQNSYAEFILGTLSAQLVDCANQYPVLTKEFKRDMLRLNSAIECHGIHFALETMPAFRKHFDQCLAKQRLTPSNLLNFGVGKGGAVPRLFRGLTLRVFDSNGVLRHDADATAVRWIRQILGSVRKLRFACDIKDTGNAIQEFLRIDLGVRNGVLTWHDHDAFDLQVERNDSSFVDLHDSKLDDKVPDLFPGTPRITVERELLVKVQQVADLLTSQLGTFDPFNWKPKHGPGAVSDQLYGSYKYDFKNWPERLDWTFPWADFAIANYAQVDVRSTCESKTSDFRREFPAKLCAVPKTLSTPRLIASEPTSLQWCQQIIRDYFYKRVQATPISAFVDFRQQDKNGSLALEASHDSSHSTIDLSSASDRISCWHVERLFRRSPSLLRALQATRSAWLEQEICRFSPRYHYLRKYSTMGNATTFPVQSLFFLSLALGSLCYARKIPVNLRMIKELGSRQVRVFGDDIIVPSDCTQVLLGLLQDLDLKVNPNKTFTEGNFRESCGVDAFRGHDVTTINILDVPKRASPGSIVSTVDVHHNLCQKGYENTAAFIQKTASRIVNNKIRFVEHGSGLFGWSSLFGVGVADVKIRHNRLLHRGEIRCLKLRVSEQRTEAKGTAGLLQYFTEAPNVVTSAISTLGHLARRPKVGLTLGWVPLQ